MTSQTKTKAKIPEMSLFVTRILFTSFFLGAGLYDFIYVVLHATDYLWTLLYTIPLVLVNAFALPYFILNRYKEKEDLPDKTILYVSISHFFLWVLCLLGLGRLDGEAGLVAFGLSWPLSILFAIVILFSVLSLVLKKKEKKIASFFYYASLICCFFALLGFSVLIAYQSFFIFGGVLYGIGSFLFLLSGSLK